MTEEICIVEDLQNCINCLISFIWVEPLEETGLILKISLTECL